MQDNGNFETIITSWRRLSGELQPDSQRDYVPELTNAIPSMSGDSSEHKKKDEESTLLVSERSKPPTATVSVTGTAANEGSQTDKADNDNPDEKEKKFIQRDGDKDDKVAGGDNHDSDKEYLENNDSNSNRAPEKKWDKEKSGDKVDSVYLRRPPPHKARSVTSTTNNDEDDCGIKCLYYTLQCCDCVLM